MKLLFQICDTSFEILCSLTTEVIAVIPKIYQLVATLGTKANSRSSILLLLLSLLPVIQVASVACDENISVHVHSGGTSTRVMTVCSLTPIRMLKACEDLKLRESYASSLSSTTGKGIHVLSSNGLTRLVTVLMKTQACGWVVQVFMRTVPGTLLLFILTQYFVQHT
jgi:hypothetical protein